MKIISHRGKIDINKNKENNLEAINNFMDSNIEMIEMDIQLTKDNNIILYHDKTIKIYENENKNSCYEELNIIDLDRETLIKNKLIYLEDVLDLIKGERNIYLDIKNDKLENKDCAIFFNNLLNLLERYVLKYECERSSIFIASFYKNYYDFISNVPFDYKKGIILDNDNFEIFKNKYTESRLPFDFISIDYNLIENDSIKKYFNKTVIFCWTVNDINVFNTIINNTYVSGIVTDYPIKFLNIIKI